MANLYQIDQGILSCIDMETGEVIDPEMLDALLMERESKIEGVALWVKNLQSDVAAYKSEIEAFTQRKEQAERKIESLNKWLTGALKGETFSTSKCAVTFRKSERVDIPDESLVQKKWLAKTVTYKPDKKAIKAAIKAGQKIKGCFLIEAQNISIK